ncbi:MAG: response regulator [Bacillota bacterium]
MKIYIVEDDFNIVKILKQIIENKELANIVGYSLKSNKAKEDILIIKPDIVLIDLLMPKKDGIKLMKEIKRENKNIHFIMISQVNQKEMISKAYKNGVDFYISKPINAVEVENVIKKEMKLIEENLVLNKINNIVNDTSVNDNNNKEKDYKNNIKKILNDLGILGENGSKDIINICNYLIKKNKDMADCTIKEICSKFNDNYKSIEQRVRRTATKGLINLANLGVEDYMNEKFQKYANGLYSFKEVKKEMDYIRDKRNKRAKINFKKFIDGLIFYSTEY